MSESKQELSARLDKLSDRQDKYEGEVFGRNFRIGMFLLCLAFVCVAGHWIIAGLGYMFLKDVVFRRD